MVRGTKRWAPAQRMDRAFPGGRGDHGCRERGRVVERRQQAGDRPRQQCLPGTRRAQEQQAVPPREGDLERPSRLGLTPNLGKVRDPTAADGRSGRSVEAIRSTLTLDQLHPRR